MNEKKPRGPKPLPTVVSEKQEAILKRLMRRATSPQNLVLRAKIVLGSQEHGRRNRQVAEVVGCSLETVKLWRKRWIDESATLQEVEESAEPLLEQAIIEVLSDLARPGTPPKFTAEQVAQIIAVACEHPKLSDRPVTEWTLRELADELVQRQIVESISSTQVWRFLKMRPR